MDKVVKLCFWLQFQLLVLDFQTSCKSWYTQLHSRCASGKVPENLVKWRWATLPPEGPTNAQANDDKSRSAGAGRAHRGCTKTWETWCRLTLGEVSVLKRFKISINYSALLDVGGSALLSPGELTNAMGPCSGQSKRPPVAGGDVLTSKNVTVTLLMLLMDLKIILMYLESI